MKTEYKCGVINVFVCVSVCVLFFMGISAQYHTPKGMQYT